MRDDRKLLAGAVAGLAAGLAAAFVMERFQALLPNPSHSDDDPATVKAADAVARSTLGRPLTKAEKAPASEATHYIFGAAIGIAYGVLAQIRPDITVGAGTAMGLGVALIADEAAVPALNLGAPPWDTPVKTHAYGLASHLVFGFVAEQVRRAMLPMIAARAWWAQLDSNQRPTD